MTGLSKSERLHSQTQIQDIFSGNNERVGKYPLLVLFKILESEELPKTKVLFSVSKKRFAKAVDRNRLKRQMRESFREVKTDLEKSIPPNNQLLLAVLYIGKEMASFDYISSSFTEICDAISQRLVKTH